MGLFPLLKSLTLGDFRFSENKTLVTNIKLNYPDLSPTAWHLKGPTQKKEE